ncbi:hypothetical protein PDESU_02822 [Pontiella desulfatans]|uniref:Type II secretion system protein J n=1 Tax=Pontiella desulfatans TaxID=2750659 RepID=A0A6C2U2Y6_PONDE|nr:hypothetical protein [Pontiella desulfatans]VGO14263.1 hypothetical protein PDESU_02822 [Pontiella desulfatans]
MGKRTPKAGLTFLELLLAVAVSGLILTAAAQLMFTFAHFWQQSEKEPRFIHHVDGVVSFIQYCLDQSENLSGDSISPFSWGPPPGETAPAIHFRLESATPFFVTGILPSPQVDGWLVFDGDKGLSMLWHVPRKLTKGKLELHQSPVSPWVEDFELGYFDAEKNVWEYESYAEEGEGEKRAEPQALRILFNQNGRRQVRHIRMRRHDRHVLVY